jgi:hypothetical protein
LFPSLQAMRTRTGRPHWIILDEAHHMLPAEWAHVGRALPQRLGETVLVTVHPDHVAPAVLALVDAIIAVGPAPQKTIQRFAEAIGKTFIWPAELQFEKGKAVVWFPGEDAPFSVEILPGTAERIRHHRKYAEGNMRYRSFFFRGPDNRHNLRAQNLAIFSQIAEGIDEKTWRFHLHRGDYSRWFRGAVKDRYLASGGGTCPQATAASSFATSSRRVIRCRSNSAAAWRKRCAVLNQCRRATLKRGGECGSPGQAAPTTSSR